MIGEKTCRWKNDKTEKENETRENIERFIMCILKEKLKSP